jgi:hypothetical protein
MCEAEQTRPLSNIVSFQVPSGDINGINRPLLFVQHFKRPLLVRLELAIDILKDFAGDERSLVPSRSSSGSISPVSSSETPWPFTSK